MNQVFRMTSETLKALDDIKKYILATPVSRDKKIGIKLFNILLKQTPKDDQTAYVKNGIPYRHETEKGFVEYTLRA